MSTNETRTGKPFDDPVGAVADLDKRAVRALTECMAVAQRAPGMYLVYGQDGDEYTVDWWGGNCTCPDFEYRGVECKHLKRVAYQAQSRPIPDVLDRDAMDPLLVAELNDETGTDAEEEIADTPGTQAGAN